MRWASDSQLTVTYRSACRRPRSAPALVPEDFDLERYASESGRHDLEGQVELVASFASAAAEHLREIPLAVDQTLRNLSEQGRWS